MDRQTETYQYISMAVRDAAFAVIGCSLFAVLSLSPDNRLCLRLCRRVLEQSFQFWVPSGCCYKVGGLETQAFGSLRDGHKRKYQSAVLNRAVHQEPVLEEQPSGADSHSHLLPC